MISFIGHSQRALGLDSLIPHFCTYDIFLKTLEGSMMEHSTNLRYWCEHDKGAVHKKMPEARARNKY
jgi:hypothetical protein